MKIFDCFTFSHELDLLEIRLNSLNDVVDVFVLTESEQTFTGLDKELIFNKNKDRFSKFLHKIRHVIAPKVEGLPSIEDYQRNTPCHSCWQREFFQMNYFFNFIQDAASDDILLINPLDEIPRANIIEKYKNEITKWLGQGSMINENKYTGYVGEGYAYGVFWEVPQLGIFSTQEEINNYSFRNPSSGALSMLQPTAKPGDIKYADTNGDGLINLSDRTVIGSPHPDFTIGMGVDFTYKNWALNIFVNSVVGKEVYNSSNVQLMNTWLFNTNKYDEPYGEATSFSTRVLNRWTPQNPTTNVPKLGSTATNGLSANLTNIEDGSFIRFENIALSYNFPRKNMKGIKTFSIFGSVQNAFLITAYRGTDPENNQPEPGGWATNQSSSILAYDNFGYPRPIAYTLGLNLNF